MGSVDSDCVATIVLKQHGLSTSGEHMMPHSQHLVQCLLMETLMDPLLPNIDNIASS